MRWSQIARHGAAERENLDRDRNLRATWMLIVSAQRPNKVGIKVRNGALTAEVISVLKTLKGRSGQGGLCSRRPRKIAFRSLFRQL